MLGIPWAAFIAERLNVPMAYIRGEKKDHGAGRQIEGADFEGKKVIVIEDLISTGGSSIKAVEAARAAGAKEVEVVAIFSYEFEKAITNFAAAGIEDLISTGGSSIKAVEAARAAGAKEVEVVAIFSYEFEKAITNFAAAGIPWTNLSDFTTLIGVATEQNYLTEEEKEIALKWNKSPNTWGRE